MDGYKFKPNLVYTVSLRPTGARGRPCVKKAKRKTSKQIDKHTKKLKNTIQSHI